MGTKLNLSGQKFGSLFVLKEAKKRKNRTRWLCLCDCGKKKIIGTRELNHNETKTCGDFKVHHSGKNHKNFLHGEKGTKMYTTWKNMHRRCTNPNDKDSQIYMGRGIKVCDRWKVFLNFKNDMGDPPTTKHTLDRINSNGHYEPSNCRWATSHEQSRNKRNNIWVILDNQKMILKDACAILNLKYRTVARRVHSGWDVQTAIKTPIRKMSKK